MCFEFLLLYCTYRTELKEGPEILLAFAENRACFLNKEPTKDPKFAKIVQNKGVGSVDRLLL